MNTIPHTKFNEIRAFQSLNKTTCATYENLWLANAEANREIVSRSKSLADIKVDKDKVALVCGAGPSLDQHYDLIRKWRDDLWLIAADMAFLSLRRQGIEPDYVVSIDAKELIKGCFEGMPLDSKVKLIAATTTHSAALDAWKGQIYFYNLYDEETEGLKKAADSFPAIPKVKSRYHVGEFCIELASLCFRFRHIGFTGIDLACPQNRYYAAGAPGYMPALPSDMLVLLDGNLRPIITTKRLAIYSMAFMRNYQMFYRRASTFYNLSKGIIPLNYRCDDFVNLLTNNRESNDGRSQTTGENSCSGIAV